MDELRWNKFFKSLVKDLKRGTKNRQGSDGLKFKHINNYFNCEWTKTTIKR